MPRFYAENGYHASLAGYRKRSLETRLMANSSPPTRRGICSWAATAVRDLLRDLFGFGASHSGELYIDIDDCEFAIITTSVNPEFPKSALDYYKQLREYVHHEDQLINFRLTWSLTIHGFLLAASGLTVQKTIDVFLKYNHGGATMLDQAALTLFVPLVIFQFLVVWLGRSIGLISLRGIEAAANAIEHIDAIATHAGPLRLRKLHKAPQPSDILLPRIIGGGAPYQKFIGGQQYYLRLPKLFQRVWAFLFLLSLIACLYALVLFKYRSPVWADSDIKASVRAEMHNHLDKEFDKDSKALFFSSPLVP